MPSDIGLTEKLAFLSVLLLIGITIICLAIPIVMLTIGILKMNDCEADPRLPMWMIVMAILMLAERFTGSINTVKDRVFLNENPKPKFSEDGGSEELLDWNNRRESIKSTVVVSIGSLIRLIQFIAFVVGCFWVFGISSERDRCNVYVFWASYIYCILSITFYALGACLGPYCLRLGTEEKNKINYY
ncbi:Protein CBG12352 [Caenorhabditis briggsae]|uniref:Protein CBG12352 n=1 Tax=Caenorhabditis briggsae TaxID=6238 RepID=A8XF82_CAEBR|nr:Protein CBG12352 [Caenorhabditis briggsae]CAP31343.2 Protein CBG12352 [Caenorhabditis briggsae]